jgi:hypothetical protein
LKRLKPAANNVFFTWANRNAAVVRISQLGAELRGDGWEADSSGMLTKLLECARALLRKCTDGRTSSGHSRSQDTARLSAALIAEEETRAATHTAEHPINSLHAIRAFSSTATIGKRWNSLSLLTARGPCSPGQSCREPGSPNSAKTAGSEGDPTVLIRPAQDIRRSCHGLKSRMDVYCFMLVCSRLTLNAVML